MQITQLSDRTVLQLSGTDARSFLNNLISNDLKCLDENRGCYAFLLTPQGKYMHDFFVLPSGDALLLDVASSQRDTLTKRLTMYKLRADVTITHRDDLQVFARWGEEVQNDAGDFSMTNSRSLINDGRATALGQRELTTALENTTKYPDYRQHCVRLGAPDPATDFIENKTTLMEAGIDGQFGVSWTKGCFVGQEPTARMKYRGLVKRLLVPVDHPVTTGSALMLDGKKLGVMQSERFALIHRDALQLDGKRWNAATLSGPDDVAITPLKPDWWDRSSATEL